MDIFIKSAACVLIASVICIVLAKESKEISLLLGMLVCCVIVTLSVSFLRPIVTFIEKLGSISKIDSAMVTILLKAVGVGLLTEICVLVCTDAGNQTLGKSLQIMATGVILWMSLPLMEKMLDLLKMILENL